jgi:hypothetical protein
MWRPGIRTFLRRQAQRGYALIFPHAIKRKDELNYWKSRHAEEEDDLSNSHYEPLYTTIYDLPRKDYEGKRVLDFGSGPRGSL